MPASVECFPDAAARAAFYGDSPVPADPAAQSAVNAAAGVFARQCGEVSGPLLAQLTTANTARDLDRLRELVGDPQLTFYGESYGSFLGQTYVNMFPDRVRAMALDGILDPVGFTSGAEQRIADPRATTGWSSRPSAGCARRPARVGAQWQTGTTTSPIACTP